MYKAGQQLAMRWIANCNAVFYNRIREVSLMKKYFDLYESNFGGGESLVVEVAVIATKPRSAGHFKFSLFNLPWLRL